MEHVNILRMSWESHHVLGITPVEGTDETVRVVSMDRDFHVDCYMCCVCGMQLTDEPDKRCYPLAG